MCKDPETIKNVINEEETQFLKTLNRGQKLLDRTIAKLPAGTTVLPTGAMAMLASLKCFMATGKNLNRPIRPAAMAQGRPTILIPRIEAASSQAHPATNPPRINQIRFRMTDMCLGSCSQSEVGILHLKFQIL